MKNSEGEDLDLTLGSPTMLKHYIVIDRQKNVNQELNDIFQKKGLLAGDQSIDWDILRTFLRKKEYQANTSLLV